MGVSCDRQKSKLQARIYFLQNGPQISDLYQAKVRVCSITIDASPQTERYTLESTDLLGRILL